MQESDPGERPERAQHAKHEAQDAHEDKVRHEQDAALQELVAESHDHAAARGNLNPASHQRSAAQHHQAAQHEGQQAAEAAHDRDIDHQPKQNP